MKNVTLYLENGCRFAGKSFGYERPVCGEVVFTTAMAGYPETLTDPAAQGDIVAFTYPLIGNAGVPRTQADENGLPAFFEGEKIYAQAVVVNDYSAAYSHWNAHEELAAWMQRHQVVGITGIDTRELATQLRQNGTLRGKIVFEGEEAPHSFADFLQAPVNRVAQVSCTAPVTYGQGQGRKRVLLVDCGVRAGLIRTLLSYNLTVVRVPWNHSLNTVECDAVCIGGGPGDPAQCSDTIRNLRRLMEEKPSLPIMGVALGSLIMAKAAGATVYRLPFGHHGHAQPVRHIGTNRCYITVQYHNYAVDADTLGEGWAPLFENLNDGSNEGFAHTQHPWTGIAFHTESERVNTDTKFLFDDFVKLMNA